LLRRDRLAWAKISDLATVLPATAMHTYPHNITKHFTFSQQHTIHTKHDTRLETGRYRKSTKDFSFPYLERDWQRTLTPDSTNPAASIANLTIENSDKGGITSLR